MDIVDPVTSHPEYPSAMEVLGVRMSLKRETRFSRFYCSTEPYLPHPVQLVVSRFIDGSAPVLTLETLKAEWPSWSEEDRMDFCAHCEELSCVESDTAAERPDLPAMIRFIFEHGSPEVCNAIAAKGLRFLPPKEAYERMVTQLKLLPVGEAANILSAIARTRDPRAEAIIREQLQAAWDHASLWQGETSYNHIASQAVRCIALLIKEFGASPLEFEDQVGQLASHACVQNRRNCCRTLWRYFRRLSAAADWA